jgi:hypothetical protein
MFKQLAKVAIAATVTFGLFGCASISVKNPEIKSVKKIAIVSVTSNYQIHDVKDKEQAQSDADLASLGRSLVAAVEKKSNSDSIKAQVQVVTHGAAALSDMFSKLDGYSLVSVADVVANPAYQAKFAPKVEGDSKAAGAIANLLQAAAVSDWVVPEGMGTIPLAVVAPSGNSKSVTFVNGKKVASPTEQTRAALGQLCADLGVDAVVIAQVKLAYKKPFIAVTSGGFLGFGEERTTRKPVVETDVAVIDAKGKLVLVTKEGWKQFEGDAAPMLLKNQVDLADKKGESIKSYNDTIDASIQELSANIAKALK